jgi:FdhD protein
MTREHTVVSVKEGRVEPASVHVCLEENVSLSLNGTPITTLKITPDDLEAFAIGFLICEGLVRDPGDISDILIDIPEIAVTASPYTNDTAEISLEVRSAGIGIRHPQGITGPPLGKGIEIDVNTLFEGTRQVHEIASVWKLTGGTHCTILVDPGGVVRSAAEDIGRHSSVDKAVGKALLNGIVPSQCFMVCTGRLPADMVAKAYRAGISLVVSNNAPFASGIELAERMNMTLVGFARPPRMSIYTHPERIRT